MGRGVTNGTFVAVLVVAATSPAYAYASIHRDDPCRVAHATEVIGRVVDGKGHAVEGVSVIASPVATAADAGQRPATKTVVSGRDGRFRLIGLAPGEYWFIGIHGDHPFGITPAMPVIDRLEIAITLDQAVFAI